MSTQIFGLVYLNCFLKDELSLTNIANRNLQSITMKKETKTELEINDDEMEEDVYEV